MVIVVHGHPAGLALRWKLILLGTLALSGLTLAAIVKAYVVLRAILYVLGAGCL